MTTELEFDLESLTGEDLSKAKRQFLADGQVPTFIITADQDYAAYVLAVAAKKPIEFFKQMPARDYARLTTLATAFLTR